MTNTALQKADGGAVARPSGLSLTTLDDLKRFAMAAAASGFVAKGEGRDQAIAKAMMIVEYGAECGIPPMASLQGVHIIEGKPSMGAGLVASVVKSSGTVNYRVRKSDNASCVLAWFERIDGKWEPVGDSSFTLVEAKQAGLANRQNWRNYTSDMLFARCLTRGARRFAPHVFRGAVYTPEELGNGTLDGELVESAEEVTAEVVELPTAMQTSDEEELMRILADAPNSRAEGAAYYKQYADDLDDEGREMLGCWIDYRVAVATGKPCRNIGSELVADEVKEKLQQWRFDQAVSGEG